MKNIFQSFRLPEFTKNVLKLSSSSIIASVISLVTLPIIANIYTATALGKYQLLVSIIIMFGVIASLKYEMAILLPKDDSVVSKIVQLSLFILIGFVIIIFFTFLLYGNHILDLFNAYDLKKVVYLIPIGIFFFGLQEIIKYSLLRKKNFNDFALIRVYQIITTQFTAIGVGWLYADFFSLFFSYIFGFFISIILFIKKSIIEIDLQIHHSIKGLSIKYKKFPFINSPMVFLNTMSNELPVFFIAKYFSMEMVGFYMLAYRLSIIPMNLVGSSVTKVFFQQASETYNQNPEKLLGLYIGTVKKLLFIGFIPFLIIMLFIPFFIDIIFGVEWEFSGKIMQILAFGMLFKFSTSPISTTFTILNKQEIALILIIFSLLIKFSCMIIFHHEIEILLWSLSISTALFYLSYNFFAIYIIKKFI